MGCDIHPYIEKKIKLKDGTEKWVCFDRLDYRMVWEWKEDTHVLLKNYDAPNIQSRNYARFGKLANVRGDGQPAKGLPDDVSDLVKHLSDEYDTDGHSHSWVTLQEALEICLGNEVDPHNVFFKEGDPRKDKPLMYFFGIDIYTYEGRDSIDNYRLVFWFDN